MPISREEFELWLNRLDNPDFGQDSPLGEWARSEMVGHANLRRMKTKILDESLVSFEAPAPTPPPPPLSEEEMFLRRLKTIREAVQSGLVSDFYDANEFDGIATTRGCVLQHDRKRGQRLLPGEERHG
jgi:hypothetical protein